MIWLYEYPEKLLTTAISYIYYVVIMYQKNTGWILLPRDHDSVYACNIYIYETCQHVGRYTWEGVQWNGWNRSPYNLNDLSFCSRVQLSLFMFRNSTDSKAM